MDTIVEYLLERVPEPWIVAGGGLVVGLVFGSFAQQSRFCLRAAVLEFAHGSAGQRLAVWLLAFSAAVLGTQALVAAGLVNLSEVRQLASPQSLFGAALGGVMFGAGMVLARGCASRLLVLAATGNLRALLSGLVFAVVAQASLHGLLRPARETLARVHTTAEIGGNDLSALVGISTAGALVLSICWLLAGLVVARRSRTGGWRTVAALGAGLAVPLAWWFTATISSRAFDPVPMEGITFTGPSAEALMLFLSPPGTVLDFGIGVICGVFLGSFLAAWTAGELRIEGFRDGPSMRRYMVGAALMGFGGMLAGGCAVGAGVTGASVLALTAWITLTAIWVSAAVTDRLVDHRQGRQAPVLGGAGAR